MDDVNDMHESIDTVEQPLGSMRRRDFLTKAAAAGVLAWSAPVILSRPAHAQDGGGGTPNCRPTFTLQCVVYDCQQGGKMFPGITVTTSDCPCSPTTPPQEPTTCIRIEDLAMSCTTDPVAYGNGTLCPPPGAGGTDDVLSTGAWECFDPAFPVFFGRARAGGGSIPALPSDCTITFRMAVWAGGCPDADSPDEAFTCQTFNVTIVWDQGTKTVESCTIMPAPAAQSLCTTVPPDHPPCCPPDNPDCCP